MAELLQATEMDRIADVIASGPYPGYPKNSDRLFLGNVGIHASGVGILEIPDGPWHITNHANRKDKPADIVDLEVPNENAPVIDPELTERWTQEKLLLDQFGRPIHPNWLQLLEDPRIGLPTGTGFFYRYGPNATIDPVVYRKSETPDETELLLIQRRIGHRWALPGGFLDRTDASAADGARREAGEETHLLDIGGTSEVILHKRPVGLRDTLNAWTENTVVLFHGNPDYLHDVQPEPGDDAEDAGWFTREQIDKLGVFDAHLQYIDTALARLQG